jgi:hypothetical protein
VDKVELLVDPAVSEAKFARELAQYREREREYQRRGWWLLQAEFPQVFIVFATPQLKPPAVVFGAELDFTNYDLWPPSVRLADSFTREPYKASELPTILKRRTTSAAPVAFADLGPQGATPLVVQDIPLMQWHGPDDVPFLCLPGVREYHDHPAHSGDLWLLHRGQGEGTLHFLVEKLSQYGVEPISDYNVQLVPTVAGFQQANVPE